MKPIPISFFSWNAATKTLVTEQSTLEAINADGFRPAHVAREMIIFSEKTQKQILFKLHDRKIDPDNNIEYWIYKPSATEYDITVKVFND